MAELDGGQLVAEMLVREKVRYVFSVSGGVLNPVYDACEERGIQIIHTRHEAAAAFMADGWARTTGDPGVVLTTLGPGVTNVVTPIFTALRATSPIVVLAGQAGTTSKDLEPGMSVDPIPILTSITKWAKTVGSTSRIPEYVSGAFRHALSGRPGPVFLEFPGDVLRGRAEPATADLPIPGSSRPSARPPADPTSLEAAVDLIAKAERPLLLAGSGVWWSGASKELKDFVEAAELPFFLARAGRGSVPEDHPLCFGPGYLPANPVLEEAFKRTDLVLCVGHRLDFDLGFGLANSLNSAAGVIQVDIEATEIGRYRPVQVGIVADARAALDGLRKALRHSTRSRAPWLMDLEEGRNQWINAMTQAASTTENPMHPLRFLRGISEALPRECVIVTSHGNIDFWGDVHFRVYQPGGYLRAGQSGCLGAEIPYGVAAKLARPNEPVVVIVGDGGFGYHCMELDTASRYGIPLIIALGNDSSWGAIALPQEREYGRAIATSLQFRHYEGIAEILGGHGELVVSPDEVTPAVLRALDTGLPSVLNVRIASVESRYMRKVS